MLNVFCLPPNPTPNLIHYPPCSTSQSKRNLRTASLTSYLLASIYYPGSLNTEQRHIGKCFPPSKARVAFWKTHPNSYTSDIVPLGFAPPCFFSRLISGSMCICVCVCAQSCPTLRNSTDCSLPGSSVCGISQARILEWVAISSSRRASRPRDQTHASYTGRWVLYQLSHPGKPWQW